MDANQIILTAGVGLAASVVTAWVSYVLARRQERGKQEREIAAKLAALDSTQDDVTRAFATQHAQACLVVERPGAPERERVFLPMGCRITFGRDSTNHIVIADPLVSRVHAAFHAVGTTVYLEALNPTSGLTVNGEEIRKPRKLANGDVVSAPGASFNITVVALQT